MNKITVSNITEIPKNYTGKIIYYNGNKEYLLNGKLHRFDGPALIFYDKNKQYYINGKYISDNEQEFITSKQFTLLNNMKLIKNIT